MSPAELIAMHGARLDAVEAEQKTQAQDIRSLRNWIMATLASALIAAAGVIVQLLRSPSPK